MLLLAHFVPHCVWMDSDGSNDTSGALSSDLDLRQIDGCRFNTLADSFHTKQIQIDQSKLPCFFCDLDSHQMVISNLHNSTDFAPTLIYRFALDLLVCLFRPNTSIYQTHPIPKAPVVRPLWVLPSGEACGPRERKWLDFPHFEPIYIKYHIISYISNHYKLYSSDVIIFIYIYVYIMNIYTSSIIHDSQWIGSRKILQERPRI